MGAGTAQLTRLSALAGNGAGLPGVAALPVLPALEGLLPGGLPRGTVVATGGWSLLCLALAAGASTAGAWCAIAGVPHLGVAAAAGVGLDPGRVLLVPDPGPRWPEVAVSLLAGCELVLLRPPGRPGAAVRKRLEASLRLCGGVLIVAGEWEGAAATLLVAHQSWEGIGYGYGRLMARRAQVVASVRGAARPRSRWLLLPGLDGSVNLADRVIAGDRDMRDTGLSAAPCPHALQLAGLRAAGGWGWRWRAGLGPPAVRLPAGL